MFNIKEIYSFLKNSIFLIISLGKSFRCVWLTHRTEANEYRFEFRERVLYNIWPMKGSSWLVTLPDITGRAIHVEKSEQICHNSQVLVYFHITVDRIIQCNALSSGIVLWNQYKKNHYRFHVYTGYFTLAPNFKLYFHLTRFVLIHQTLKRLYLNHSKSSFCLVCNNCNCIYTFYAR